MVFEIEDARHPLCAITAAHPDVRAVYRVVDTGAGTGRMQATITVLAGGDVVTQVARELRAVGHYDELEIASLTPYAVVFKVSRKVVETPPGPAPRGGPLTPLERLFTVFGTDTIFEPFFCDHGVVRARAIVAEPLETKRALVKLQELQRAMAWEEFRVVRVTEFKASRYAESLRRILSAEQEELLRLSMRLGYYDSPKKCTLQDIAAQVGLSVSPVHKKLKNVEQILVTAYVDPTTARTAEVRRRSKAAFLPQDVAPGAMAEVTVRAVWPSFALAGFSQRHPNALLILHPLADEPGGRQSLALLVVVAESGEYRELIEELSKRPEIHRLDFISRDTDHASLKLRWTPTAEDGPGHGLPLARLARSLGRDVHLKPILVEGGEVVVKAFLTRPTSAEDVHRRLEDVSREVGWKVWEMLSLRRVEFDPALAASPTDRMTARQAEILKIAHALGYYRTPRGCTLDEIARTLGISANAIHKNLTAAEQKIVGAYLAGSLWYC